MRATGSLPSGEPPFDVVLANLIAGVLVPLAPALRDELRPGRDPRSRPGIFVDREARGPRGVRGGRARRRRARTAEGDWVALEARRPGLTARAPYNRGDARTPSRSCSRPTSSWRISLVLPSILLPFALRTRRATVESGAGSSEALLWAQTHGTIVIGVGLALTGLGLVARRSGRRCSSSRGCSSRSRSTSSTSAIAFFIQRPNLRRLIGIRAAADDETWLERAKRQRYVSYLMAGLVGTIGFLMSSKPVLW